LQVDEDCKACEQEVGTSLLHLSKRHYDEVVVDLDSVHSSLNLRTWTLNFEVQKITHNLVDAPSSYDRISTFASYFVLLHHPSSWGVLAES
jgi:hypothetical protein